MLASCLVNSCTGCRHSALASKQWFVRSLQVLYGLAAASSSWFFPPCPLLRLLPQSWSLEGTGALHITHTLSPPLLLADRHHKGTDPSSVVIQSVGAFRFHAQPQLPPVFVAFCFFPRDRTSSCGLSFSRWRCQCLSSFGIGALGASSCDTRRVFTSP
jgi:hypothetical protein